MSQFTPGYTLYVLLYSVFWSALAVIAYRAVALNGPLDVAANIYFFLAGLVCLLSALLRMLRLKTLATAPPRCPIIGSLNVTGLLLILISNFIGM